MPQVPMLNRRGLARAMAMAQNGECAAQPAPMGTARHQSVLMWWGLERGGQAPGMARANTPPPKKESLWLLEAPVSEIILQMHTPARTSQCWSRQTPHGLGVCIWMHLVNGTGNSPSPGRPTPGVVKQDKSSGGSVDTTKTRSGPQRGRLSSGKRPIGAAKGKQPNTEALCHPPLKGCIDKIVVSRREQQRYIPLMGALCIGGRVLRPDAGP